MEQTKKCSKCGADLPIHFFNKNRRNANGLRSECVSCQAKQRADYRTANSEKIKSASAARYWSDPEGMKERAAVWARSNPEKRAVHNKHFDTENKKNKAKAREAFARNAITNRYVLQTLLNRLPGILVINIPPDLIEMKREQITIHRLSRQLKQSLKPTKERK